MRLLITDPNPDDLLRFAKYLTSQGIENRIESETDKDWGSSSYGDNVYRLWIIDEDKFPDAQEAFEKFQENPQNRHFDAPVILQAMPSSARKNAPKKRQPEGCLYIYYYNLTKIIFQCYEYNQH